MKSKFILFILFIFTLNNSLLSQILVTGDINNAEGTIELQKDYSFLITQAGEFNAIILDEWVSDDGGATASPITGSLNYKIDSGPIETLDFGLAWDNEAWGNVTQNDGWLIATSDLIPVIPGQTVTFFAGTLNMGVSTGDNLFNYPPSSFDGELYLSDWFSGKNYGAAVPESSSYAAILSIICFTFVFRKRMIT